MKLFGKETHSFAIINIEPNTITLATATAIAHHDADTIIMQHRIFNQHTLYDLLTTQKLSMFIVLLYPGSNIHEIVTNAPEQLSTEELTWEKIQLSQNLWYSAGMRHELLFHYKLFFINAQLSCAAIMTQLAATLLIHPRPPLNTLEDLYHWHHKNPLCPKKFAQYVDRTYGASI